MYITILTLFPKMFDGPFAQSILKNAQEKDLLTIKLVDIRDYGIGKHKTVDDTAYGGGTGMVMRVDVIHEAIQQNRRHGDKEQVILMTASGTPFTHNAARELSHLDHLMLICGHYEGIDERITKYIDGEISIGDFVTTGGEIPAMLITDAVTRLIPGVLKPEATELESFSLTKTREDTTMLLEYPHYTRPTEYDGQHVPAILASGDHKKIAAWREEAAHQKTKKVRPEFLNKR